MDDDYDDELDDLEDFLDFMERNAEIMPTIKMTKRYIRDQANPFEFYSEGAFLSRFKFSKDTMIHSILPLVEKQLHKEMPLAITNFIYFKNTFFIKTEIYKKAQTNLIIYIRTVIGDLKGFSQATACISVRRVSVAFAESLHKFIHFPNNINSQQNNIKSFYQIARFPNVAACIDGTLIKVQYPSKDIGEVFRSVLLGDNGYACQPYLLTPVLNPINEYERAYNSSHKKTRITIERTFGRWKRKFSALKRGLLNKINNSIAIIFATAVLWNLHISLNYPVNLFDSNMDVGYAPYLDRDIRRSLNGLDFRLDFIIRHFG
ncbi:putative nuclease HARBI1 [Prorops nasuta]|uniref:putative nuclease HARBI1 n=1 Tax=Prorops nasuta TaxID=863751 RepID=UPI0034CFAB63